MKRLSPLLALLAVGVALAAEPVVVALTEPDDVQAAVKAQEACRAACAFVADRRKALADAEAMETAARAARAQTLAAIASRLNVTGTAFSVRVATTRDGDGSTVTTVSLVATQE